MACTTEGNRDDPSDIPVRPRQSTIETVLPYVGEFGRYQRILSAVLCTACLPACYEILIMYFLAMTPSWKCNDNSTYCIWNGTLAPDDNRRCHIPRSEWYYTEASEYSIVTEFDIQCGEEWKLHLLSSIMFVGWGFGGMLCGWLGDRYGRKSIFYPSTGIIMILGFIVAFLHNIYLISVCQFIIGFVMPGTQLQAFVIICEYVGTKQRPFFGILVYLMNPISFIILAGKAYLIKKWRILAMVCTAPYLFTFAFIKFIPESFKWLHLHGKKDEVMQILRRIGKWNKRSIEEDFEIVVQDDSVSTKVTPLDLCGSRWLTSIALTQGYLWLVTVTCYYGLHMAANDLGGSAYRDFIFLNVVELPGVLLSMYICYRAGRKIAALIPLFIGSLLCIVIAFIPQQLATVRVILGVSGDFFIAITFNAIYMWSVEIFPLKIRNDGMGFLQVVAHFGSVGAPWIVKGLKTYGYWCPFVTLGVPALLASFISLRLPETKDMDAANTDEVEGNDVPPPAVITNESAL